MAEGRRPRQGHDLAPCGKALLLTDQQDKQSDSYQQGNQNTDDERRIRMPTGLDLFRPSAFLRCSDAEPEEKVAHRRYSQIGLGPCPKEVVAGLLCTSEDYPSHPKICFPVHGSHKRHVGVDLGPS